ncbi:MAG TPA: type III pantothenate kinase [Bacillota bacterium]|nr:type III pantothenate kinase [Bacillota bacterium]
MLFVIDVGNTHTVLGVFAEEKLTHYWRIKTDRYKTEDELSVLVRALFDQGDISFSDVQGIAISSVVPPINQVLNKMSEKYFGITPLIIGRDNIQSFIDITYPKPKEIGADRIVNAVGALEQYEDKLPFIIIDFGTATTFCYVNEQKQYVGGIISPGVNISLEALYNKASKLPRVEIQPPNEIVGQSTVEAMQSGVYYGYLEQVDGMIRRIEKELNIEPYVIATGGMAPLIVKESKKVSVIDDHLTLRGLWSIYYHSNKK